MVVWTRVVLGGVLAVVLHNAAVGGENTTARTEEDLTLELGGVERKLLHLERALVTQLKLELEGVRAAAAVLRGGEPSANVGKKKKKKRNRGPGGVPPPPSCPLDEAGELRANGYHRFRVLSHRDPRLSIVDGFMSPEECEHIRRVGASLLKDSVVVGASDGAGLRRSRSASLNGVEAPRKLKQDRVLLRILDRISALTYIPLEHFEPIQLGEYTGGDFYGFHKDSDSQVGRTATFLVYLEEPEAGGETIFPALSRPHSRFGLPELRWGQKDQPDMTQFCDDARVFKVKPKLGSAILFWNHHPDLQADPYALHGSCPVKAGKKTVLQQWIRFWNDREGNVFYNKHIRPWERSREG
eukprot:Hpha_TRINITY_DN25945_c0_g1::TRINITY_DN25945_c0_g1_i1::g.185471::m.185471/K00472/P4HA; prolyl 4-hydroxylase